MVARHMKEEDRAMVIMTVIFMGACFFFHKFSCVCMGTLRIKSAGGEPRIGVMFVPVN
jgi:hypothetical protein